MEKLTDILKKYSAVGDDTKNKVLGGAFIVVNKDKTLYANGAGRIDAASDAPSFTPDSFTWVASVSKILTTVCILQMVEDGLIGLDDDTRPLVPELAAAKLLTGFDDNEQPILKENTTPITLRQLIIHTSGMAYDILDPQLQRWSKATGRTSTNSDLTLDGWNTPLVFPPGGGWEYSSGLDWAGQVLEKATGKGLEEYMTEKLLKPLGMNETTFHPKRFGADLESRTVKCSYRSPADGRITMGPLPVPVEPPIEGGGSGIHSTASDYAKFFRALLAAGSGAGEGAILRKESVDEMFRPQLSEPQCVMMKAMTNGMLPFPPDMPVNHGISGAMNMEDIPGKRKKGSLMWGGVSNTHWWVDPTTGIAGALFLNVIPQPDPVVFSLYDELEKEVYASLC